MPISREHLLLVARGAAEREADSPAGSRWRSRSSSPRPSPRRRRAPCTLADTVTVRLPFRCWICAGPLSMRDGRDLLERHHHVAAAHRDRQVLDVRGVDAVFGMQAHRDVARFADRDRPSRRPRRRRTPRAAPAPRRPPRCRAGWRGRGRARSAARPSAPAPTGRRPPRPGSCCIFSMKSLVISMSRRESGP